MAHKPLMISGPSFYCSLECDKDCENVTYSRGGLRYRLKRPFNAPRSGEVYNIGGGKGNSISVLEAFENPVPQFWRAVIKMESVSRVDNLLAGRALPKYARTDVPGRVIRKGSQ